MNDVESVADACDKLLRLALRNSGCFMQEPLPVEEVEHVAVYLDKDNSRAIGEVCCRGLHVCAAYTCLAATRQLCEDAKSDSSMRAMAFHSDDNAYRIATACLSIVAHCASEFDAHEKDAAAATAAALAAFSAPVLPSAPFLNQYATVCMKMLSTQCARARDLFAEAAL